MNLPEDRILVTLRKVETLHDAQPKVFKLLHSICYCYSCVNRLDFRTIHKSKINLTVMV